MNRMSQAEALRVHLAACFAVLGNSYDRFRPVWSGATHGQRKVFLLVAGESVADAHRMANQSWDELNPGMKARVQERVRSLRDWLNEVVPE